MRTTVSTLIKDQEAQPTTSRPASPLLPIDLGAFQRQLTILVLSLALLWLVVEFLERFEPVLQPFFIACFIAYIVIPLHTRLVRRGVPTALAYVLILALTVGGLTGLGWYVYGTVTGQSVERWENYQRGLDKLIGHVAAALPEGARPQTFRLEELLASDSRLNALLRRWLRTVAGEVLGVVTTCFVVLIYLVFVLAEKASFPVRIHRAFDQARANQILNVIDNSNRAIANYIGLKTFVSFLQGSLSFVVLALFDVDFALMWGLLIFLFNFIPYLGSLIAVTSPIVLCFVQHPDQPWRGILVAAILLLIQRVVDNWIEPRLAGRKLGLSPLLIILSLAFWGAIWGIVGMVLAVPLTAVGKIILENIRETRPIAALLSNE
jgi:predicted PurR-regulated permease PerM